MNTAPFFRPFGSVATLGAALLLAARRRGQSQYFQGADLKHGEQLIAQGKCTQCHISKVGGWQRHAQPKGKINDAGLLRGMVEQCNTC